MRPLPANCPVSEHATAQEEIVSGSLRGQNFALRYLWAWVYRRMWSQGFEPHRLALPSDHLPRRVLPCPSAVRLWGPRFALVMGGKPEDAFAQFQRAHCGTIGTLHRLHSTVQESLWRNLHPPYKWAFACCDSWEVISDEITACGALNPWRPACARRCGWGDQGRFGYPPKPGQFGVGQVL
jgi:hypothetical protein